MNWGSFTKIKQNPKYQMLRDKYSAYKEKGTAKQFLAKLSRGLMLPIAILPIAGLLLGIGGAIGANIPTTDVVGTTFANIFKGMSDVVFANLPVLFAIAITITFSKDKGASGFCSLLAYLVFASCQLAFLQIQDGQVISVLWFHKEITGITTTTLGMPTLQTSIFGGIIVGALTSYIYNRVSLLKLPTALDFFSGVRLVPFVLIPTMFLLSLVFLVFWPWVGQGIFYMGQGIQSAPAGTGGLLYGILGRALMPFGLHHIPITLAFQTSFGGVLDGGVLNQALIDANIDQTAITSIMDSFKNIAGTTTSRIEGDQNIWNFINSLSYNELKYAEKTLPVFDWFYAATGVYAGRFTQDYPTYMGVCMGIGAALIYGAEKRNRRNVSVVILSAMLVAFFTGITEPLEFTFLFCAPWLYYLIYVPLSGFSYMFMELLGAHVGVGFARGFIDLIIYGAIPVLKGTAFYWAFLLAAIEGAFAFGVFWYCIKKFNLATPGRGNNPMNLMSKKDYQDAKSSVNASQRILAIIEKLGGKQNIQDVSACATRLRVTVNTSKNIDTSLFVPLGSKGAMVKGNGLQLIFGGEASILADQINEVLQDDQVITPTPKVAKSTYKLDSNVKKVSVYAPCDGQVVSLSRVPDDLFKSKALGDGIAILPTSFNFNSILKDGWLVDIFDTKHAYTFKTKNGIDILLHIGIDTVKLTNIFTAKAQPGTVTIKTPIVSLNQTNFKKSKSMITPIVVPELGNHKLVLHVKDKQKVKKGDLLFSLE